MPNNQNEIGIGAYSDCKGIQLLILRPLHIINGHLSLLPYAQAWTRTLNPSHFWTLELDETQSSWELHVIADILALRLHVPMLWHTHWP